MDQDSDNDFTIGGASINESAQETYRDRLLAELRVNTQEPRLSKGKQTDILRDIPEMRQEILNLLGEKYGFNTDQDEEEHQYEEAALQNLICGPLSEGDGYPRKPLQPRQRNLDYSVLNDGSAVNEKAEGESGSETEECYLKKGFQARQNTLNLSEFKEHTDLPEEDQCSWPGFLEELQEGLRRRGMDWRLSSEEDSCHSNDEHSQSGASENLADAPLQCKVENSSKLSNIYGGNCDCDGGSCTTHPSHMLPAASPSGCTHYEEQGGVQGDSILTRRFQF